MLLLKLFVSPSPPACKWNHPNDRRELLAFVQFVAGNYLNSLCPRMHHAADGDQKEEVQIALPDWQQC